MDIVVLKQITMMISIVMASSNSMYAAEIGDDHNSGEWVLEEVAGLGKPWGAWSPSMFNGTSIAIDSADMPHIAYQNLETLAINYSYRDTTGKWQTETVVEADVGGASPALALTGDDRPVICYHNLTVRGVSCAFLNDSVWRHDTVDAPIAPLGNDFSLALDAWNRPHLAYYEVGTYTRYAWWNGTSWNIIMVRDGQDSITGTISMDVDSSNSPHIVLGALSGTEQGMWYFKLNGTRWDKEVVDTSRYGAVFSMKLDDSDNPHFAMMDSFRHAPLYVYRDEGSWRFRYIDLGADVGFGSFSLDSSGKPHVAYTDRNQYDLRYANMDDGSWKNETVDSDGWVGFLPSIVMDESGIPHISYIDLTDRLVMYATKKKQIKARIDIDPDTLNLWSRGRWITCYIELPAGYDPRDINASSILLDNRLRPELNPKYGFVKSEESFLVDHDGNGIDERMIKFDRHGVTEILDSGDAVHLTITGKLNDGMQFEGEDTIEVVDQRPRAQATFSSFGLSEELGFGNCVVKVGTWESDYIRLLPGFGNPTD